MSSCCMGHVLRLSATALEADNDAGKQSRLPALLSSHAPRPTPRTCMHHAQMMPACMAALLSLGARLLSRWASVGLASWGEPAACCTATVCSAVSSCHAGDRWLTEGHVAATRPDCCGCGTDLPSLLSSSCPHPDACPCVPAATSRHRQLLVKISCDQSSG